MLRTKLTIRLVKALITLVALTPNVATGVTTPTDATTSIPPAIRLVLRVSKGTYRVGDPIEILAYLQNTSDRTYYVGNELLGLSTISSLHYMLVTTEDASGEVVKPALSAATSTWEANTTIKDKLSQAYTQLRPNTLFGASERGNVALLPGRYRLRAEYREIEALRWSDSERRALLIPVWTQQLVSNTVTIRIVPRSSRRTHHKR